MDAATAPPEQLKTITILAADVTGSTELGERLDPEAVRRVMERYFELARQVIARHGGTIEKFIGDAVVAVFGVPFLHEDDALRAVRSAAELQQQLSDLNRELERDYGTTLRLRTGVNTGQAVTATDEWLAVGDAVNVAARLEQVAAPGQILLGPETFRLVRDAVAAETLDPIELRGKSRPLTVYRLLEVLVDKGQPPRRLDAPMVGRTYQLRMLEDAFANVVRERTCVLFTLLGVAGVGKSRLAEEFLAGIEATVARGRCLSYGEGITYWPVAEVLRQLLAADTVLEGVTPQGPHEEAAVGALFGESGHSSTAVDIAWSVRKLLERAAAARPLVVVFDDLQWGEETFFDLIEHVADLSRESPILLLCLARPELRERRPTWGGGKLNATTVLLEPLNSEEARELIDRALPSGVGDDLRTRALEAASGNPLFLEEIAAVMSSSPGDQLVPPTIQALLAARLDQLEVGERRVLERGSIEGNSFHRGSVEALAPAEEAVGEKLVALVRKDLVRPEQTTLLPGEDAFRFRHLLIRDAAYERLPKSVRAELHRQFADWLDRRGADLAERDEIVGYHLEQAYAYRRELGPPDAGAQALAAAAAGRLEAAGRRALDRDDGPAALSLLERASALTPSGRTDVSLELSVVWAMFHVGRLTDAIARAGEASDRAGASGDIVGKMRGELARVYLLGHSDPEGRLPELAELIVEARPVFEESGDDAALASLWLATWAIEHNRCRFGAAEKAARLAVEHATAAGELYIASFSRVNVASAVVLGPTPVDDVLEWLDQEAASLDPPPVWIDFFRVELLALTGRHDEARAAHRADLARMTDRGDRLGIALSSGGSIEIEAGDFAAAEEAARRTCALLDEMGERSFWSTKACGLAQAIYYQDRYQEAEAWARQAAEVGAQDDLITQMMSRQVLAKVAGRTGRHQEARALVAEVLTVAADMDFTHAQGQAALDAAETLWLVGDADAGQEQFRCALAYFERKGATASLQRALRRKAALEGGTPSRER